MGFPESWTKIEPTELTQKQIKFAELYVNNVDHLCMKRNRGRHRIKIAKRNWFMKLLEEEKDLKFSTKFNKLFV